MQIGSSLVLRKGRKGLNRIIGGRYSCQKDLSTTQREKGRHEQKKGEEGMKTARNAAIPLRSRDVPCEPLIKKKDEKRESEAHFKLRNEELQLDSKRRQRRTQPHIRVMIAGPHNSGRMVRAKGPDEKGGGKRGRYKKQNCGGGDPQLTESAAMSRAILRTWGIYRKKGI